MGDGAKGTDLPATCGTCTGLARSGGRSSARQLRELGGDVCGGATVLKAGASAISVPEDGSQLAALMRAMPANAAQTSIFATGEPVILGRPWAFSVNRTLGLLRRGKSSIKR